MRPRNRELLRQRATCLLLSVPPAELARRLRADPTPRPALVGSDPVGEIAVLAARRGPLYSEVADAVLFLLGAESRAVTGEILFVDGAADFVASV